ncbi:MAG: sugar ABC transporter substrate-binding protein [Candidatus Hydrogenedentes bacterium]|nr:sugar ABC transporter substrate-binding protein [Candidatus Hydrogenedentota bacterium]
MKILSSGPLSSTTRFLSAASAFTLIALTVHAASDELWMQVYSYDLPGEQAYYDDLTNAYAGESGSPMVRITLEKWDHAHDQIADWFSTGEGPDLIVVPDIWLAEFAEHIEPFESYVTPEMRDEFYEVLYNKGIYKDHLLGLVWATSTKALFYRTDLFEKAGLVPPKTWAEQLGAAVALNDPPHVHGLGIPGAREYETDDNFFCYFWSAGGRFFDDSGKCTLNSEAGVQALQFYCDLVNKYHVTQPEVTTWNRKQTRGLLEQGKLAMFATGPWGIEQMRKNAPGVPFAVVPLPILKEPVTQIITDHLVLAKYSPRKEEAARFVQFAYQDEHRLAFAKKGILPEKKAVAADAHFQDDPNWKVFVDVIPTGHTIPLMQWEEVGIAIREAMYQALSGRKTPQEALDELVEVVDKHVAAQK